MITPKTRTPGGVGTLRHVTMLLGARSNTTLLILSVKGWGGTPQIRYHLFAKNFVRKGGGGTPHIRNLFLVFIEQQKHNFLPFLKKGEGGGKSVTFFGEKFVFKVEGGIQNGYSLSG